MKIKNLILLCLVTLTLSFGTGCNTTPQAVAFKTATAVQVTVDDAMTAWGDYVQQFHPSDQVRAQVRDAYYKYRAAAVAVIDAGELVTILTDTNLPAGVTTDAADEAQARQTAVAGQAAQDLADLVNLLRTIGVKI